jgi:hypothetical protein
MASQSAALGALVAAIPHVGRSIDVLVSQRVTKTEERRLQFMFAELHRQLRGLDESRVRKDFLDTEEWADFVRQAVALAVRTSDCGRLSAIARVLAVRATGTVPPPGPAQVPGHEDVVLAMLA